MIVIETIAPNLSTARYTHAEYAHVLAAFDVFQWDTLASTMQSIMGGRLLDAHEHYLATGEMICA